MKIWLLLILTCFTFSNCKKEGQFILESDVRHVLEDALKLEEISSLQYDLIYQRLSQRFKDKFDEETQNNSSSLIQSVASKITLINVLYFGGAVLVMGSMTFFVAVGFGRNFPRLTNI